MVMTNQNGNNLIFLIGAPRSGTTILERILASHPQILGGPEPHLMTPLAHLGVWRNVEKAPYDHIVAGIGQSDFVSRLSGGMQTYYQACAHYAQTLYGDLPGAQNHTYVLDKTPEYATIWPFIKCVFPKAKFIVLTRHPAAILSSFAHSFFDGDYQLAYQHDPLFERYIPALAGAIRDQELDLLHLRYEELTSQPQISAQKMCEFLNLEYTPSMLQKEEKTRPEGLGDPIGLNKYEGLSTDSQQRWAIELATHSDTFDNVKMWLSKVSCEDLATVGYAPDVIWNDVEKILDNQQDTIESAQHSALWTKYKLQRKAIIGLRQLAQNNNFFRKTINKLRVACDVVLREY